MWAVMVWSKQLIGKYFWIHVDNEAVATILNTGSSREPELQNALREIALMAAQNEFVLKAKYIPGVSNRVPDWLSRWHDPKAKQEFRKYSQDKGLKHIKINHTFLHYTHEW